MSTATPHHIVRVVHADGTYLFHQCACGLRMHGHAAAVLHEVTTARPKHGPHTEVGRFHLISAARSYQRKMQRRGHWTKVVVVGSPSRGYGAYGFHGPRPNRSTLSA